MNATKLQDHMAGTYFTLRRGMVAIAFAFPVLVAIGGTIAFNTGILGSLSAYYYTGMRDLFVGLLVAIGACLFLYKGFSISENRALNLAGIFVVVVAMRPTEENCGDNCTPITIHRVAAVLFFLCIAYVAIFKGPETLKLLPEKSRKKYRRTYKSLGTLMILSPGVALISSLVLQVSTGKKLVVVLAEWFAVWIFATYWLFKSRELATTAAEKRALDRELETVPASNKPVPGRLKEVFSTNTVQEAT